MFKLVVVYCLIAWFLFTVMMHILDFILFSKLTTAFADSTNTPNKLNEMPFLEVLMYMLCCYNAVMLRFSDYQDDQ